MRRPGPRRPSSDLPGPRADAAVSASVLAFLALVRRKACPPPFVAGRARPFGPWNGAAQQRRSRFTKRDHGVQALRLFDSGNDAKAQSKRLDCNGCPSRLVGRGCVGRRRRGSPSVPQRDMPGGRGPLSLCTSRARRPPSSASESRHPIRVTLRLDPYPQLLSVILLLAHSVS